MTDNADFHKISKVIDTVSELCYAREWDILDNYIDSLDPDDILGTLAGVRASVPVRSKLESYDAKIEELKEAWGKIGKLDLLKGLY